MATARLEAILGLNTRAFEKGLARARAQAAHFAKAGLKAVGVAAVAAGVAMTEGTRRALAFGAEMDHLSSATGISVRDLTILRRAFEDNGISADSVGTSVGRMQRAITEARQGLTTYQRAFEELGLSTDKLLTMEPGAQFKEIADALARMPNPTRRAATAMQIFGRAGSQLLPLFTNGGAIDSAIVSLGKMPGVLDTMSAAFERADTIISGLPDKATQFFVGFSSEIIGSILDPLEEANKKDFTELGRNLGKAIRPWIEAIGGGEIWDLFGLHAGKAIAVWEAQLFDDISNIGRYIESALVAAFEVSANFFERVMRDRAATILEVFSKIPGLGGLSDTAQNVRKDGPGQLFFGEALQKHFDSIGPSGFADLTDRTWQRDIDKLMKKLGIMGDDSQAAAAAMKSVKDAAGEKNSNSGLTGAFGALEDAAGDLLKSLGFSSGDVRSGKRGQGRAQGVVEQGDYLASEAQIAYDRSVNERLGGDSKASAYYASRAIQLQQQANDTYASIPGGLTDKKTGSENASAEYLKDIKAILNTFTNSIGIHP